MYSHTFWARMHGERTNPLVAVISYLGLKFIRSPSIRPLKQGKEVRQTDGQTDKERIDRQTDKKCVNVFCLTNETPRKT